MRHSVELSQIHDVLLFCKSLEGQFKLLVLVDAAPAELRLAAAAEQTAAESSQSVLDQVREVVGGKLLLALNVIPEVLLSKCWEQGVLCWVNLLSVAAWGSIETLNQKLVLDKALVSPHEETNSSEDSSEETTQVWEVLEEVWPEPCLACLNMCWTKILFVKTREGVIVLYCVRYTILELDSIYDLILGWEEEIVFEGIFVLFYICKRLLQFIVCESVIIWKGVFL